MNLEAIRQEAMAIAREAGSLIRQKFGKANQVDFKGSVDPVTEVDKAAETLILSRLRIAFPAHLIHSEESGGSSWRSTEPLWLVDPLDGTNNFAHSFPYVSVSLGFLVDGDFAVGVVYDPLRDEMFSAVQGTGAMCNGHVIHVSQTARLADAFLATGFHYDRRVAADNNARTVDHFLRRSQGVRRTGSAALDLANVACGRFDGYWERLLHPWDLAAGVLIVKEAGGTFSDYAGKLNYLLSGEEVVASNGLIHPEILQVLQRGAAAPHPDFPDLL